MGLFTVAVQVAAPGGDEPAFVDAGSLLVDTGSEATWIPGDVLRSCGVSVRKRDQDFLTADGRRIVRDVGYAVLRTSEFETVDEVVFAHEGDLQLLGARTMEGFNAVVDPVQRRLVAAGPMPAASWERAAITPSEPIRGRSD